MDVANVEQEALLRRLLALTPDVVYLFDLNEGRNLYSNRQLTELLGFTPEYVRAMGSSFLLTLIHPDDGARVAEHHQRLRDAELGTQLSLEYRLRHQDGQFRWLESRDTAFSNGDDGKTGVILGVCRDITEQRELRQQIEESAALYRLLTENTRELVCRHTLDGTYTYVSPASVELLGYEPEELVGVNPYERFHPDDQRRIREESHEPAVDGSLPAVTYRYRHKDGHWVWLETLTRLIETDGEGGLITTSRDVSIRVQATRELERANDELTRFAHVTSHDLRAPLRTIISFIDLIERDQKLNARGRELFQFVQSAAMRMQELLVDLLAYARIGGGNELVFTSVPLLEVLREVEVDLTGDLSAADASLELRVQGDLQVWGHRGLLRQALTNLLANAIKFRAEHALEIAVEANPQAGLVELRVKDNGIGFDAKHSERIFEVFKRLHGDDTYAGTGVGLSIVRRIIELHSGSICAESSPGQGATFIMQLPSQAAGA